MHATSSLSARRLLLVSSLTLLLGALATGCGGDAVGGGAAAGGGAPGDRSPANGDGGAAGATEPRIDVDDDFGRDPTSTPTKDFGPDGEPIRNGQSPNSGPGAATIPDGKAVQTTVAGNAEYQLLLSKVTAVAALDAQGLNDAYPAPAHKTLSYKPADAQFLDRIQASALALNDGELAVLGEQGLVVTPRQVFPTFLRGYAAIYSEHLPVYVSADAMLDTVHRSYDAILLAIESDSLVPKLGTLLQGMRNELKQQGATAQVQHDVDLYLEIAQALLTEGFTPSEEAAEFVDLALAAEGMKTVTFMGGERVLDFSQFTPRGHYAGDPTMERYFRAMMWLGRVDLRIVETQSDGTQVFNRGQYEMSLLFNELMSDANAALFEQIDNVVRTFVGESDYLTGPGLANLVADLGGSAAAKTATDQQVAQVLAEKGYGAQQISSHIMVNDGIVKTLPLNRSFLLFGQRYIVDSHVFSEIVYDRINDRMMPSPLDAAFAALKNNDALPLNQTELDAYAELPGALGKMRTLVDAHDDSFWSANFYNLWMKSLRTLSDRTTGPGLPEIAHTEAWGKRLLNAQLGSWAQLRHDTLLYAKQSYTGVPGCEFPDAYVEPYPEFFAALETYAEQGAKLVVDNPNLQSRIVTYYTNLRTIAGRLKAMAQIQRDGLSYSEEQLAFINNAVRIEKVNAVCVTIDAPDGWYADLFFDRDNSIQMDVTIADVHTQPADEAGNPVGKVLHVGTALPRLMVTTIDTCDGPKAYVGMSYAYHEQITKDFKRLNDEEWQGMVLGNEAPADVPWLGSILGK